jgi:uncharacterized protein
MSIGIRLLHSPECNQVFGRITYAEVVGLLPKNETFWGFFTSQTTSLSAASSLLAEAAKSGNSSLAGAAVRIKTLERESAQTLRDLQAKVRKTFITPLDSEDISLLSEQLDRLLDDVEAISYRLVAYKLDPVPPYIVGFAQNIYEAAELIEKAFGALSLGDSVEELCRKVLAMEEQTDQAVRETVTRLFDEEKDWIAVLKKKEILDIFERLSDSMQDLANSLQNVAIKNA